MNIYFRDRQYNNRINASFFLSGENERAESAQWMIGDSVRVLFTVDKKITDAMENMSLPNFQSYDGMVHIPCRVVERSHAISWKKIGQFQSINSSVVLEAADGYWGDVLLWVVLDHEPEWALIV